MIDPVTMREVWSLGVNDKTLYNNSRIIGTWSALKPKGLGLRAFNRMIYWKMDEKSPKIWKVKLEKLSIERFIDWGNMKV